MGRRWLLKKYDERTALTIAQRFGLNELIGRILVTRGVRLEEVEHFLNPSLRNQLPDPGHLKDMVMQLRLHINLRKVHKRISADMKLKLLEKRNLSWMKIGMKSSFDIILKVIGSLTSN